MLGGNGGLVSSTMPQEADRGCAEMCYPRPSGTSTTKKQGIKINHGPAWQGNCRNRKYPTEGETASETWGKTLGLLFFVWLFVFMTLYCFVGGMFRYCRHCLGNSSGECIQIIYLKKAIL